MALTPVHDFGGWWAKREDAAGFTTLAAPSGAKVRQYLKMIADAPKEAVLVVGCAADSAMQIYVAHAAKVTGRQGYVVIPSRKDVSAATQYALDNGVIVVEVTPGYPSVYRARARELGKRLGVPVVRWDMEVAAWDTAREVWNIPAEARTVVVPTGSGLTAAAVLGGLALDGREDVKVLAVAVSDLATREKILATCNKHLAVEANPDRLFLVRAPGKYASRVKATLPDSTVLDPYYAAKALGYVLPGDVLWVSGRRPSFEDESSSKLLLLETDSKTNRNPERS